MKVFKVTGFPTGDYHYKIPVLGYLVGRPEDVRDYARSMPGFEGQTVDGDKSYGEILELQTTEVTSEMAREARGRKTRRDELLAEKARIEAELAQIS